jgi:hypothetical protein
MPSSIMKKLQANAAPIVQLVDGAERIATVTGQTVTEIVAATLGVPLEALEELDADQANGGAALRPPAPPTVAAVARGGELVE